MSRMFSVLLPAIAQSIDYKEISIYGLIAVFILCTTALVYTYLQLNAKKTEKNEKTKKT